MLPAHRGSCVDLHAPGVDILSATNASASGNAIKSGTSMACPHISGVVALYLEQHQVRGRYHLSLQLADALRLLQHLEQALVADSPG